MRTWSLRAKIVTIVILVCLIACIPFGLSYFSTKTYVITVTDKEVKNDSTSSKYLIFTELENGETKVFCIEDSIFKWRFNSSDVYAEVKIGETYSIDVIGWRYPFLSMYENIMSVNPYYN